MSNFSIIYKTKIINTCPNCEMESVVTCPDNWDEWRVPEYTEIPHQNLIECITHLRSLITSMYRDMEKLKDRLRNI